jgi:hypothetical protein
MITSNIGWILFSLIVWLLTFLIVPLRYWRRSWHMGLFGMVIILVIDSKLAKLGAFRSFHNGLLIYGLPLPYWIAYFPGGIFFDYLRPKNHLWRFLYIPIISAAYLIVELIMMNLGYFQYLNWKAINSFILNLIGFTVSMWFAEWWEEGKEKKESL